MIKLLERDDEISTCERKFDETASGVGACVVIEGGAGAGKSALLTEVARIADGRGLAVVKFRASYAERDRPLGFALHVFRSVVRSLSPEERTEFLESIPEEFHSYVREPDRFPDYLGPGCAVEFRRFCTVLNLLLEREAQGPVLLAVDNLPWLDCSSLSWLLTLLEHLDSAPVVVVGTTCGGEPGTNSHLLDEVIAGSTHRLHLKPLGPAAVSEFLGATLATVADPPFVAAVVRMTGGNPLLLELLTDLMGELDLRPTEDFVEQLMPLGTGSLALALRVRLRRISDHAFPIFQIANVLGEHCTVENITRLSGLDQLTVVENCHMLDKIGLLDLTGSQITIGPRLIRNSVLRDFSPAVLYTMHAKAAELLNANDADPRAVADYLLVATHPLDRDWVAPTLRAAAVQAIAANDTDIGARYLRRALAEPLPPEVSAAVLTQLASADSHRNLADAARSIRRALSLSPRTVSEHIDPGLFALLSSGAFAQQMRTVYEGASASRRADLRAVMVLMEHLESENAATPTDQHTDALSESMSTVEHLMAQIAEMRVLATAGQLRAALRHSDKIVQTARRLGHLPLLAIALTSRSSFAWRLGALKPAVADVTEALELSRNCDLGVSLMLSQAVQAQAIQVFIDAGKPDKASEVVQHLELHVAGSALLFAKGQWCLNSGDLPGAIRHLTACGDLLTENPEVSAWRSQLALALARSEKMELAHRYVTEELSLARAWGAPGPQAAALRVQALISDHAKALPAIDSAIDLLRTSEERLSLAQALVERGRLLRNAGDYVTARQALREAHEFALESGLDHLVADIRHEITAAGGRAPRPRLPGVRGLTESELRAATLAAQGRKNREIAEALLVRLRTIEIHLSNTYRKLGISGRDELAEALTSSPSDRPPRHPDPPRR